MLLTDETGNYSRVRTVEPTSEPVSTAEAIRQLKRDGVVDKDSLNDTQGSDFANTTHPLTVTAAVTNYPLITFVAGQLVKVGSEIMEVTLVSGNDVTFQRGVLDTQIVSHADSTDVFIANSDEGDIWKYIVAAREYAEEYQWSALMTQTWELRLDRFPAGSIRLPRSPLVSITSIAYQDSANATQTLTAVTDYTVDANSRPGRVVPAYSTTWPVTYGHIDDVTITFIAGYGAASTVPYRTKQAIALMVDDWYWNRGPSGELSNDAKTTVDRLLDFDSFRRMVG